MTDMGGHVREYSVEERYPELPFARKCAQQFCTRRGTERGGYLPRQMVISLVQTAVHSDGGKPHGRVRGDEKYLAVLQEDPGLPGALLMVELTAMLACDGRRTCMESQATKSWPWLVQIRNRDF